MLRNIAQPSTGRYWLAHSQKRKAVMTGAISVATEVQATDSATSLFDRKVMTFEDVPSGQQSTRMTLAATSGGIGIILVSRTARRGMMRIWPSTPVATSKGRFTTSRKSSTDSVRPSPNMMIARSVTIHGPNASGVRKRSRGPR